MCETCDVTRSFDARRASVSAFVCVVPAKGKWTKDQWSKMKSKKRPRENTPVLDAQTEAVDREQFLKAFESKFYFVIYWCELKVRLIDVGCFHFETWLFYIKAHDKTLIQDTTVWSQTPVTLIAISPLYCVFHVLKWNVFTVDNLKKVMESYLIFKCCEKKTFSFWNPITTLVNLIALCI